MTSLGAFRTSQRYYGRCGDSLRLEGLEKGINDNALERGIVIHGAGYVNEYLATTTKRVGTTWGCPAVPQELAKSIMDTVQGGSLVYAYADQGRMYAQYR